MAAKTSRSFAFVPADDFGMLKPTDRKLIRSQCMRGKNKKKGAHAGAVNSSLATYDMLRTKQYPLPSLSGPVLAKSRRSRDPLRWGVDR